MYVVIIECVKHVFLNKHIPTVTDEGFAGMLNLGQKGSNYVESQGDCMWQSFI